MSKANIENTKFIQDFKIQRSPANVRFLNHLANFPLEIRFSSFFFIISPYKHAIHIRTQQIFILKVHKESEKEKKKIIFMYKVNTSPNIHTYTHTKEFIHVWKLKEGSERNIGHWLDCTRGKMRRKERKPSRMSKKYTTQFSSSTTENEKYTVKYNEAQKNTHKRNENEGKKWRRKSSSSSRKILFLCVPSWWKL